MFGSKNCIDLCDFLDLFRWANKIAGTTKSNRTEELAEKPAVIRRQDRVCGSKSLGVEMAVVKNDPWASSVRHYSNLFDFFNAESRRYGNRLPHRCVLLVLPSVIHPCDISVKNVDTLSITTVLHEFLLQFVVIQSQVMEKVK